MARLSKVPRSEADPAVQAIYDRTAAVRGAVPNLFRIYAHRPEIMVTMAAHLNAVTNTGSVPTRTKELVATLVSRINRCDY